MPSPFEDSSETRRVTFIPGERKLFRLLSAEFFGRILRHSELFDLCGAPQRSIVHVGTYNEEEIHVEFLEIEQIGMMGVYRLCSEPDGLCLIIGELRRLPPKDCEGGIGEVWGSTKNIPENRRKSNSFCRRPILPCQY